MKMTGSRCFAQVLFVLISFLLSGCGLGSTPWPENTYIPPTDIPTFTPGPTWTPWPTVTITPTATITPTPAPRTWDTMVWSYCKGVVTPYDEAPEIVPGQAVTEYQYYHQNSSGQWVGEPLIYGDSNRPQVVICAVPGEASFANSCEYNGGYKLDKYGQRYHFTVYSTHTGKQLLDLDDLISPSDDCQDQRIFSNDQKVESEYARPDANYFKTLLAKIQ